MRHASGDAARDLAPRPRGLATRFNPNKGLGGTRTIHDGGGGGWGQTELHIANPKKYTSLKF